MRRKRLLLVFGVVVVLAIPAGIIWRLLATSDAVPITPEQPEVTASGPPPAVLDPPPQPDEQAARHAPEEPLRPDPPAASELARVLGRCVAAEAGAPLAGCTVRFRGRPGNSAEMAKHGPVDWDDPEPVVTGPDGQFEFAFVPPPPYQHSLDAQCEGRVPRTARWGAFQPGQVEDLGDIELCVGYGVEGQVMDTLGAPVAGIRVSLENLPLPIRGSFGANTSRGGISGEDGRFRISTPIPAGTWTLDAGRRGLKLVSPDCVTVREGRGAGPITVVMRGMPSISGVVVDETGAPVPGVSLHADLRRSARSGRMAAARTGNDGTFTMHAVDDALTPVRIKVYDPGPCEPPVEAGPEHEWGVSDVHIVLRRALSFELTVVEREGGAPVEEYAIVCHALPSTSSSETGPRLGDPHPDGRVTVDKVWHGPNLLQILPRDPTLAPSEPIEFDAVSAPLAPIRVELDRQRLVTVLVVTRDGDPVAGSTVDLYREGGSPWPDHLARADSDERGEARIAEPRDRTGLVLFLTGKRHLPLEVKDPRFPEDGEPLRLVVPTGGRLVGSVRIEGYAPGQLGVALERHGGPSMQGGLRGENRLADGGSFELEGVEPGGHDLYLTLSVHYRTRHGSSGHGMRLEPRLAQVLVEDSRTTEVELDASGFAPARLNGRVLLDGAPASDCRGVVVYLAECAHATRFGEFTPDPQGHFEALGLPPGDYRAGITVGDLKTTQGDPIVANETFFLSPGQILERTFSFERRLLRLRILEPDGKTPVANAEVRIESSGDHRTRRTDAEGRLALDPAPAHPVTIRHGDREGGPASIPSGEREAEVDVVLRERG